MSDILQRLRAEAADVIDWHGQTMKRWDEIRHECERLPGSDLPRLMFESMVESLAELMVEGADEIERMRNALTRIVNGGTSVLISAVLDECPINPDVLEQIIKDAAAGLGDALSSSPERGK